MNNDDSFDFSPSQAPRRRTVWLIFSCAVMALFVLLGRNALLSSESELAECVRQLQLGRDILTLPPETWQPDSIFTCFAGRIAGLTANLTGMIEWTYRFPAALAAIAMLAGTMSLCGLYFDNKTMNCSGWLLFGSYGFLYWGRHGSWNMTVAALVVWFAYFAAKPDKKLPEMFILSLITSVGTVLGGWIFILPALPVICCLYKGKFPAFKAVVPAILIALIMLFSLVYSPLRSWESNLWMSVFAIIGIFRDSFHSVIYPGGSVSWYQSLENLPRLLLPWLPVSAVIIAGTLRRFRETPEPVRKLLICALAMFVLCGIFPGKRWQYQLPLLPFFITVTAAGITGECGITSWNRRVGIVMEWIFSILGALTAALALTYPLWDMLLKLSPPLVLMTVIPLLGLTAVGFLVFDTGANSAVEKISGMYGSWSGYILAGVTLSVALWCIAIPSLTKFRTDRPFWKKCGSLSRSIPPKMVIFAGKNPDAMALYYMNMPDSPATCDIKDLPEYLNKQNANTGVIIFDRRHTPDIHRILLQSRWEIAKNPSAAKGSSLRLLPGGKKDHGKYVLHELKRLPAAGTLPADNKTGQSTVSD